MNRSGAPRGAVLVTLLALLALVVAACTPPEDAPGSASLLLVPNYGNGTVEALSEADLVAGGAASGSWSTDPDGNGFDGLAYGPDGRLYVSDYDNDTIVVVAASDMDASGDVTPLAVISLPADVGPVGAAFDSQGSLWVGAYNTGQLLRFDDVVGAVGNVDRTPSLTLTVDTSGGALAFDGIYDVFVDHLDNVWIADYFAESIYRFEAIASLTGTQTRVPDLFLEEVASAVSESGFSLYFPTSLLVDSNGTLYVGNDDFAVSRFDDALSLSGSPSVEASAYLDTGIDFPYMVALDASGALWVAHYDGELVKLPNPASYTGNVDVSADLTLQLSWLPVGGDGFTDGGTMKFVPAPQD